MSEISIALLCTLAGTTMGVLGFIRTGKKDIKDDTACNIRLESKLDYVSQGVDDIRLDMKDHGRKIESLNERLVRVEESTKSAHHRLDEHIKEGE